MGEGEVDQVEAGVLAAVAVLAAPCCLLAQRWDL